MTQPAASIAPTTQLTTVTPTPAAAPAPPEMPAAPAAPETPKVDHDAEVSQRLDALGRREARSRRLESEQHAKLAKLTEREKEIEAKLAKVEKLTSDPIQYLLDEGHDPVGVAKRFVTPETPLEKEVRLLKEERASEKAEREKYQTQQQQRAAETQRLQVLSQFVSGITPDNSPHLVAMHAPTEIDGLVTSLLDRPFTTKEGKTTGESVLQAFKRMRGRIPTNGEIRETLEAEAEMRATKAGEVRSRREAALAQSQAASQGQLPSGPGGISNQGASATHSGKTRKPSLEDRRREARKELTEALEAEAATRE